MRGTSTVGRRTLWVHELSASPPEEWPVFAHLRRLESTLGGHSESRRCWAEAGARTGSLEYGRGGLKGEALAEFMKHLGDDER
jgi:hypothetical protein